MLEDPFIAEAEAEASAIFKRLNPKGSVTLCLVFLFIMLHNTHTSHNIRL